MVVSLFRERSAIEKRQLIYYRHLFSSSSGPISRRKLCTKTSNLKFIELFSNMIYTDYFLVLHWFIGQFNLQVIAPIPKPCRSWCVSIVRTLFYAHFPLPFTRSYCFRRSFNLTCLSSLSLFPFRFSLENYILILNLKDYLKHMHLRTGRLNSTIRTNVDFCVAVDGFLVEYSSIAHNIFFPFLFSVSISISIHL